MSAELLRIVDGLARDKNIDKDLIMGDLKLAMETAIRKKYGEVDDIQVSIDPMTGEIEASAGEEQISLSEMGRIAAQSFKQVLVQRIREAERGSIFEEFVERKGQVITGTVARFEGGALVVSLGRTEGFLPRSEQIPGEAHQPGERIRAMILDVREAPHQVRIILSRSHPDFIRRLFELEVPEVAERIIEIKALSREAGYRTKVAVTSIDAKVDAVGACVGVRGSRIKNIVEELGGEKIDIVRWNESSQILIANALKPAEVQDTALCFELGRATVVVPEDQLSLAIGKRGQNVRLGARLTGWDIDILTPKEYNRGLDRLASALKKVVGVEDVVAERVSLMGFITVMDVEEVGADPLIRELGLTQELADQIVECCKAEAVLVREEMAAEKAQNAAQQALAQSTEATDTTVDGGQPTPDGTTPPTDEAAEGGLPAGATDDEVTTGAEASPTNDEKTATMDDGESNSEPEGSKEDATAAG
jgi:N utilization substance protein A